MFKIWEADDLRLSRPDACAPIEGQAQQSGDRLALVRLRAALAWLRGRWQHCLRNWRASASAGRGRQELRSMDDASLRDLALGQGEVEYWLRRAVPCPARQQPAAPRGDEGPIRPAGG